MIKLGNFVKDKISGFSGIVIAITDWQTGCRTIGVKAQTLQDGKPIETQWFDEKQLEVEWGDMLEADLSRRKTAKKDKGGPRPIPRRNTQGA